MYRRGLSFEPTTCRTVASLTVSDGQEFHFPHFFLKFRLIFLIFPQILPIFFLILALRASESPTREGPGYATDDLHRAYNINPNRPQSNKIQQGEVKKMR